jgi:PTS system N-acetylglucosamine-specific IIC component
MVIMHALGVHLGFSFSAGLFDFVLNYSLATRPLWLVPIGIFYFALYYGVFHYGIVRFNLATPGRDASSGPAPAETAPQAGAGRAARLVSALGGAANLSAVDACTTRLRLSVVDSARVDIASLTRLGAMGVVRPGPNAVQVVLGPIADQVAGEIRRFLRAEEAAVAPTREPAQALAAPTVDLLAALGGATNVISVDCAAGRLVVRVQSREAVELNALNSLCARGAAISNGSHVHVLLGSESQATCLALRARLAR